MKKLMHSIFTSKTLYALVIILASVAYLLKSIQPTYSDFSLTTPSGATSPIEFPGFMSSTEAGVYRVAGKMTMKAVSSSTLRIIPDDEILSLKINQQPVNLSVIPHEQRKDYSKGFTYDLSDYLNPGSNEIEILYSDRGGLSGIVIRAELDENLSRALYLVLVIFLVLIALKILRLGKVSLAFKTLFIAAILIRVVYYSVTTFDVRDHDMGDHISYVEYLAANWTPPPLDYAISGAFFHPPLYYYTGAVFYKLTQLVEPQNKVVIYRVHQLLSLAYSLGFVFFGLLILQNLLDLYPGARRQSAVDETAPLDGNPRPGWQTAVASLRKSLAQENLFWIIGALFAFWPSAIIHSVRIANDPLLYFLFSASLYYSIRWYNSDQKRDLMLASILGAAAVLTKANGEILVAVLGVIGLYKMIKTRQWATYFKMAIVPCLIMFFAVSITIGPGLILTMQGKRDKLYIDDITGISTANLVGNTASNYLWFDAKIFITQPFTDPYDDAMGRQFFLNYIGKTSLIGEFKYTSALSTNTAIISSFLAIWMAIYTAFGIYRMRKEDFKRSAPILLAGVFLWGGVTYMRMTFPANIDFRYIVPILLTFCSLYAMSILSFERIGARRLATIGKTLSVLFTLSGILFILGIS